MESDVEKTLDHPGATADGCIHGGPRKGSGPVRSWNRRTPAYPYAYSLPYYGYYGHPAYGPNVYVYWGHGWHGHYYRHWR